MSEAYIVLLGEQAGQRTAQRLPLLVPVELATGRLEALSDLAVREAIKDLQAEQERRDTAAQNRAAIAQRTGGWSPFDALRKAMS